MVASARAGNELTTPKLVQAVTIDKGAKHKFSGANATPKSSWYKLSISIQCCSRSYDGLQAFKNDYEGTIVPNGKRKRFEEADVVPESDSE